MSGFIVCLIAVEHVLDEIVQIPQAVIEQPDLAAHFYVVQEVSEEQALVTLRGFCRYDELVRNRYHYPVQNGSYQLPLVFLDAEPNHLLIYYRSLQPSAIAFSINEASFSIMTIAIAGFEGMLFVRAIIFLGVESDRLFLPGYSAISRAVDVL